MKTLTPMLVFALLPLATHLSLAHAQGYKHLATEPLQAKEQRLAEPATQGVFSHATLIPITNTNLTQTLIVDSVEASPVALIGPNTESLRISLQDPDGQLVIQEKTTEAASLPTRDLQVGSEVFPAKQFELKANKPGRWKLNITDLDTQADTQAKGKPIKRYLMIKGDPNYKLYSYRDNIQTTQGSQINLVAFMMDAQNKRGKRQSLIDATPFSGNIQTATALITLPDGNEQTLTLRDDGRNGDAVAGDGRYSAALPSTQLGVYTQELQVNGIRPDGLAFSRTTSDLYPVIEQSFSLTASPAVIKQNGNDAELRIPVNQKGTDKEVFVGAEIWGTNARGKRQIATWVGGITTPNSEDANTYLSVFFDSQWLSQNELSAPYQVRAIRLQNAHNHTPMDQRDRVRVEFDLQPTFVVQGLRASNFISTDASGDRRVRIVGQATATRTSNLVQTAAAGSKLMLVHGYCSNGGWNTAHFSNAVEFKDYNANRSHDEFAKRIRDAGAAYSSFGVVAHSQGGAAALHLYAKYVSGLDNASGGRRIQSVGTPYQGTALAGNLAVLGQIFGAGCGKNTDLTYSGASNWLATIPSWAKSEVDYYTTSFKTRWWAYDYCHLATDLLLDDPEDGTTEKWAGQLAGGVNKGHKTGWCHTSGMRDPAQTGDTSRNSSMSSRAAR